MTLKTLLFGSAAALATVGVAQAADLAVAEPVAYVKVCDAFGPGYWYSPGTQTCIRIGGYVRFDVTFSDGVGQIDTAVSSFFTATSVFASGGTNFTVTGSSVAPGYPANANQTTDDHQFRTAQLFNVTAKSMTEYGPLTGFIEYANGTTYTGTGWRGIGLSQAYIEWGPLLAGHTTSIFGYTAGFDTIGLGAGQRPRVDQVRFSWASGGFGLQVALQDYRDGTNMVPSGKMPDVVGAVTFKAGDIDLKVAAAWGDRAANLATRTVAANGVAAASAAPDTWGVLAGFGINLPMIAAGDRLVLSVAYSANSPEWISDSSAQGDYQPLTTNTLSVQSGGGTGLGVGSWTNVAGGFRHYWLPAKLWSAVSAGYHKGSGFAAGNSRVIVAGDVGYTLATNLNLTGELVWQNMVVNGLSGNTYGTLTSNGWTGKIRLQRDFP